MGTTLLSRKFLAAGADVSAKDNKGWTPAHWAVSVLETANLTGQDTAGDNDAVVLSPSDWEQS